MADPQKQLQTLSDDYQKLQTELDSTIAARQKLESQQQENKSVQKEFASLDDDANIYKLVGPVLLKQDRNEAVMAVDGRLEFIEKEIKRIEGQIKDLQEKSDKKRAEIVQFQSQLQQQAAAAAASSQEEVRRASWTAFRLSIEDTLDHRSTQHNTSPTANAPSFPFYATSACINVVVHHHKKWKEGKGAGDDLSP
ncbi:hypothetical protein VTN00DRAFT_1657 [Thermoascus crustaceus]|uniref:uncharacterized protein n=1 Tax=Thermoascus crustaceus TaxID=5088 RepID=UPI0037442B93